MIGSILDEAEKPKGCFAVTDDARRNEDGSLMCYPVWFSPLNSVAFVISVCYSKRGVFHKRFANSYSEVLEPFALRLRLVYSLLGLKALIRNDCNTATPAT